MFGHYIVCLSRYTVPEYVSAFLQLPHYKDTVNFMDWSKLIPFYYKSYLPLIALRIQWYKLYT